MAIITCPECGKEISDRADTCPHCGYPIKKEENNVINNVEQTYPNSFVIQENVEKKGQSVLGIFALIFSILGCTFWLGIILAIVDFCRKDGKKKTCSIIAIVVSCVWILIGILFGAGASSNDSSVDDNAENEKIYVTQENFEKEDNKNESSSSPKLSTTDLAKQLDIKEYHYVNKGWGTYYFMEVTNNSDVVISVETNIIAKDENGKTVGAESNGESAIAPDHKICMINIFDSEDIESYDYTISAREDDIYESAQDDLSCEFSETEDGIIVTCTNNGEEAAEFVEGKLIFFCGDEPVYYNSDYFTDDDYELKSGDTLAKSFDYYGDQKYDNYKFYITGRR